MSTETSKARTRRLASLAMPRRFRQTLESLRHQDVVARMGLGILAMLAMGAVMRIWNPPFPYYVGATIQRDIVARVPFITYNDDETERNREIAAAKVPYIYTRNSDNETLVTNINAIRRILEQAMQYESFEALPGELKEQFSPLEGVTESTESAEESRGFFKFLHPKVEPPRPVTPPPTVVVPTPPTEGLPKPAAPSRISKPETPSEATSETMPEAGDATKEPPTQSQTDTVSEPAAEMAATPAEPHPMEAAPPTPSTVPAVPAVPAEPIPAEPVIPPLDDLLSKVCSKLGEAMNPFFRCGLLHVSDVVEDPLARGSQSQVDIVEPTPDMPASLESRRETVPLADVLIERNFRLRQAIRQVVGSDHDGDLVYYCICRNWKSNLTRDLTLTQKAMQLARDNVVRVEKQYETSQRIVPATMRDGVLVPTLLTPAMVSLLRIENEAWLKTRTWQQCLARASAGYLFMLLLLLLTAYYVTLVAPQMIADMERLITVLSFSVLTLFAAVWLSTDSMRYGLLPLILYSQIITIQYRRRVGVVLGAILAIFTSMALGLSQLELFFYLGILLMVTLPLDRLRGRVQFVKIALYAILGSVLTASSIDILTGMPMGYELLDITMHTILQLLTAGLLIQGLIPFLERFLGVLSDARLLELCDVSNPLLNELVTRAPSTYNHSIALGTIAEKAADAINADGLLVRTAAYYHDIGKIYKPEYYAENQSPATGNPHDALEPTMSALIIIAHVKNGIELARQYHLPEQIIDLIEQHHGSTLVGSFYNAAKNRATLDAKVPDVDESTFRYPCLKPQTKEAVVLMLADSCESACRSLVDPAPARIEGLVRKISQARMEDSQFDESGMTLSDLRVVEDCIIKGLISYHHGRIKYPERIVVEKTGRPVPANS
ncbi:MAG: HDIG domain-containing protein [Planctomycetia bacterium]|nr:HDIG domain-containing protein [Planctomycetia bacterium]